MNHLMFCGREINVVAAVEKWKRPEDMRRRTGVRGHEGHHSSRHGRSLSRSRSRSRSPRHGRHAKSLSHSPAPRSRNDYSASSKRKEERQAKSSRQSEEHDKDKKQRSCTPDYRNDHHNGSNEKEERQSKSLRQLQEHDEDKKWGYCTPDDGNESNDRRVADNVSNQRRAATDGDGSRPHRRSLRSSSGSRSRRRDDYLDSPKGKEERLAKSPRQSKEHDEAKKRRSDTPDDRNDCRDADNGYSQRDDYSTSPKRKEEGQEKSPELSKEHDKDKKRRSYTPSDRNNRSDADNGSKERLATTDGEGSRPRRMSPRPSSGSCSRRRDDYSPSAKGKEERHAKSPRQSNEHDEDKKRRSYTHDRNDRRDADNGYNERQEDYSTSPKRKEERQARSPKLSKEHDKDKKWISYTLDDRNDRCDADNGSKERTVTTDGEGSCPCSWRSPRPSSGSRSRMRDGYSASPRRKEERLVKSPRQSKGHDEDKNRRSYDPDDRKKCRDADNGRSERDDCSTWSKRKEERQAKLLRLSNEHDKDKKQRSYTPDNRNDRRDADNCSKDPSRNSCQPAVPSPSQSSQRASVAQLAGGLEQSFDMRPETPEAGDPAQAAVAGVPAQAVEAAVFPDATASAAAVDLAPAPIERQEGGQKAQKSLLTAGVDGKKYQKGIIFYERRRKRACSPAAAVDPAPNPIIEHLEGLSQLNEALVRKPIDYRRSDGKKAWKSLLTTGADGKKYQTTINFYERDRTATDERFWSIEQEDLYNSMYCKKGFADNRWIDWDGIRPYEEFQYVEKKCHDIGLLRVMAARHDWHAEMIKQFFATVYINPSRTSLTWMTGINRKITVTKRFWEEVLLDQSVHDGRNDYPKIKGSLTDKEEELLRDADPIVINATNRMLRKTIFPKAGDASTVHNENKLILYHIVFGKPFDVVDMMLGEIQKIPRDTRMLMPYAPYIMLLIGRATGEVFVPESEGSSWIKHPKYNIQPQKPRQPQKIRASKSKQPFRVPPVCTQKSS